MAITDSPAQFEIGRVVSRTFGVMTRNIAVFLPLAALTLLPLLALYLWFGSDNPGGAALQNGRLLPGQIPHYFAFVGLGSLTYLVCALVLQAAIIHGSVLSLNSQSPTIGGSLATAFRVFPSVLAIGLVSYVGYIAGFALLIVPGIILMLMWSVAVPVRIVENTGLSDAFSRSRALTKGHRWKLLGLFLMYFLVALIIGLVVKPLLGISLMATAPGTLGIPYLVVTWLVRVVLASVGSVGIAAVYFELRLVKEGIAPAHLADAFD